MKRGGKNSTREGKKRKRQRRPLATFSSTPEVGEKKGGKRVRGPPVVE